VSVPHALNEQAKHVAFILDQARKRNATTVEATLEAEDAWVAEIRDKANLMTRFYSQCTPGYYNSEGQAGNTRGFFSESYGAGPLKFFSLLAEWRDSGDLAGVDFGGVTARR
jgi:hypothetical protein